MARVFTAALLAAFAFAPTCLSQESPPESTLATSETHRVTGVVLDELTGKPLSGAKVQLQLAVFFISCPNCRALLAPPASQKPEPPRETVTGADGSFAFDNVPEKDISVTAIKPGYFDAWNARRHPDEPPGTYSVKDLRGPITLRLAPEASISGILRDHNGNLERKETYVSLWRLASWGGWPRLEYDNSVRVDSGGTYHFGGLRPGHYYLIADPPDDSRGPSIDAQGKAIGEVPVRYPEYSAERTKSFFTLHAGELAHINFQFLRRRLHHVSGVLQMSQPYSFNIIDVNGSAGYSTKPSPFDKKFEAWLPAGIYWVSTGREGEVTGPVPFEVEDSDLPNLSFSVATPARIEVPLEISSVGPRGPTCPDPTPACGFFLADLVRFQPGGYVEVVGDSTRTPIPQTSSIMRNETVSIIPGDYTVSVAVTNNVYAKSVVSGATDLAIDRLSISAGESPQSIQIVLAEGAIADGVVLRDSEPARAWVYAVAQDIESKADFRVFQPVASQADGKFRIEGLAPGSYLFFASDIELPLVLHDSAAVDYWRPRGKIASVEPGKITHLILNYAFAPDVP
jgi:hypothetical protein